MDKTNQKIDIFERRMHMVKRSGLPTELQQTLIDIISVQRGE